MSFYISICTDMAALKASGAVSEDSPYRGMIDGRSGAHVQYSADGTMSMIVLTSIDGLEALALADYIVVATPEEILGHITTVYEDEDGAEIAYEIETPGDPDLKVLYDAIYPRTEVTDEAGNVTTPPKLFAVPGGQSVDHIL